jgi:hypothetical protein
MREMFIGEEDKPETFQFTDFHARPPDPELLVGSKTMSSQLDTDALVDKDGTGYTGPEGAVTNTETEDDT